jgi:branched-chain amino acid transport system substrate-binding protein
MRTSTHRGGGAVVVGLLVVALAAAACGSAKNSASGASPTTGSAASPTTATSGGSAVSNTASAPGVTPTSIKVALVTSLTGSDSSNSTPGIPDGFMARIDAQNAQGGVYGRKISAVVEDDQSSPASAQTAVEVALHGGAFAIDYNSPFAFGAAHYLAAQKIPVVGGGYDGPEWTEPGYSNMFSTSYNIYAQQPVYTTSALFDKEHGATRVAVLGYGESPSSKAAALGDAQADRLAGLAVPYVNVSLPFGTVDVTSIVLAMKAANVNGLDAPIDGNTLLAILTAGNETGIKWKVATLATGYGQPFLNDSQAVASGQGAYFGLEQVPVELHTPATVAEQAAFAQYEHFTGTPGFDWAEGWTSADLLIKGLETAGQNPTRASFVANLRKVTSYDASGLLPNPVDFETYQTPPKTECYYIDQLVGSHFVVATPKPVCGTLINQ